MVTLRQYRPLPETEGGADFDSVYVAPDGKPWCITHGAMNKVSPHVWRCLQSSKTCRAGCEERRP